MSFKAIVEKMKSRGFDKRYGSGQFKTSRDRGTREHKGLDVLATAGESVMSPIDGEILREARPYKNSPLEGLEIRGVGPYAGFEVKLFYVKGLRSGPCLAGEVIGNADDLSVRYPGMPNHVHMEVRYRGQLMSPADTYRMCF